MIKRKLGHIIKSVEHTRRAVNAISFIDFICAIVFALFYKSCQINVIIRSIDRNIYTRRIVIRYMLINIVNRSFYDRRGNIGIGICRFPSAIPFGKSSGNIFFCRFLIESDVDNIVVHDAVGRFRFI
ncbi:unknown [Ruminococcus sp. CAG:382]|nr:unknown [Ruminococcus sp. CAG:382]